MPFVYCRTVRFQDTDAAGVVYFANVLSMCHEAYEASLAAVGIDLKAFFGKSPIAIPIVHASVDLRSPMFCGEEYEISVAPVQLDSSKFEIRYEIEQPNSRPSQARSSQALTAHVAIDPIARCRVELPAAVLNWLQQTIKS
ncbi:acyl-CoA thioesterase [Phormidium tenue FACHB-886]|nr:acyl-CoA thioesterase [Phormidium tenue FACHB-886]